MSNSIAPATPATEPYDYIGQIIAYEALELDEDAVIELFQYLIDKGIIMNLQGSYQRTAQHLINAGICTPKGA